MILSLHEIYAFTYALTSHNHQQPRVTVPKSHFRCSHCIISTILTSTRIFQNPQPWLRSCTLLSLLISQSRSRLTAQVVKSKIARNSALIRLSRLKLVIKLISKKRGTFLSGNTQSPPCRTSLLLLAVCASVATTKMADIEQQPIEHPAEIQEAPTQGSAPQAFLAPRERAFDPNTLVKQGMLYYLFFCEICG